MNNEFLNVWNNSHKKHFHGEIIYDEWLDKEPFKSVINNSNGQFLDLGCGQGNNTLFLIEKNKNVLSADLSDVALKIVKENITNSKVVQIDMSKKLEFKDNQFDVIISDFSLQYFNEKTTFNIINELKRVLRKDGYLILRLSSTNDVNYGAMLGDKLEKNFYFIEKRNKRYYNEEDIRYFFNQWDICFLEEYTKKLKRYQYERSFFEVLVRNKK